MLRFGTVVDVGSGIGRVCKHLLGGYFDVIDLVEQNGDFLIRARDVLKGMDKVRKYICAGAQDVVFEDKYDVIWVQWTVIYLTDDDFVAFLRRCVVALNEGGVIVVKENITRDERFVLDTEDCSLMRLLFCGFTHFRSNTHMELIYKEAGLNIVHSSEEVYMPGHFPVKMYALTP